MSREAFKGLSKEEKKRRVGEAKSALRERKGAEREAAKLSKKVEGPLAGGAIADFFEGRHTLARAKVETVSSILARQRLKEYVTRLAKLSRQAAKMQAREGADDFETLTAKYWAGKSENDKVRYMDGKDEIKITKRTVEEARADAEAGDATPADIARYKTMRTVLELKQEQVPRERVRELKKMRKLYSEIDKAREGARGKALEIEAQYPSLEEGRLKAGLEKKRVREEDEKRRLILETGSPEGYARSLREEGARGLLEKVDAALDNTPQHARQKISTMQAEHWQDVPEELYTDFTYARLATFAQTHHLPKKAYDAVNRILTTEVEYEYAGRRPPQKQATVTRQHLETLRAKLTPMIESWDKRDELPEEKKAA